MADICSAMSDITSSLSVQLCVQLCNIAALLTIEDVLWIKNLELWTTSSYISVHDVIAAARECYIYSVRNVVKSNILFMYSINILFVVVYLLERTR